MSINGFRIILTDTAGIRETEDPVEKIGVERSEKARREADATLLILDGTEKLNSDDRELLEHFSGKGAVVINKTDLPQAVSEETIHAVRPDVYCITVSAKDPESMKQLREYLAGYVEISDQLALTQPRHLDAVKRAVQHLKDAMITLDRYTPDVASTDLQEAQAALSEITGDSADEKLLDRIFAQFCVGK